MSNDVQPPSNFHEKTYNKSVNEPESKDKSRKKNNNDKYKYLYSKNLINFIIKKA